MLIKLSDLNGEMFFSWSKFARRVCTFACKYFHVRNMHFTVL